MKKIIVVSLLILFLSGCATNYRVRVNGYLDPVQANSPINPEATLFVLTHKDAKNPLFDNEIKHKIESLLLKKGYKIGSYSNADYLLDFSYAMSPGKTVTEIIPVYQPGETGTIRTYTSTGKTRVSYIDYPGYTTNLVHKYTVYTSSLTLNLIDANSFRSSNETKNIWIGEAANTSEDPDIRVAINYLLLAVFDSFGQNTHVSVIAKIPQDDPRLKDLLR